MANILNEYDLEVRDIGVSVYILKKEEDYSVSYNINISGISKTTEAILEEVQEELVKEANVKNIEIEDSEGEPSQEFIEAASEKLDEYFPYSEGKTKDILQSYLLSRSLGMGYVDFLLEDPKLEEITINNAESPLWVYHMNWGWLKTNIFMSSEDQIKETASRIGRKVGRQLNTLNPLLDAYLTSGERVNATIDPITPRGNTITLRKFAEDPWTITKFIENDTINAKAAAFLWTIIEYEMSILVVGGTASGKTSMLNALANFIPPNQRIISIEDTRELRLAKFLYWVPMITRLPNSEGKGEVDMEDLLVNSLRMRPDRILVGEVRRHAEAETMFEAIHTGHSCYGTFHANNAEEAVTRLTNKPVDVPQSLLPAVNLILTQYRNRRTGERKTLELAEMTEDGTARNLFRLDQDSNELEQVNEPDRIFEELKLFTGLDKEEIKEEFEEKEEILNELVDDEVFEVDEVGEEMAEYYSEKNRIE